MTGVDGLTDVGIPDGEGDFLDLLAAAGEVPEEDGGSDFDAQAVSPEPGGYGQIAGVFRLDGTSPAAAISTGTRPGLRVSPTQAAARPPAESLEAPAAPPDPDPEDDPLPTPEPDAAPAPAGASRGAPAPLAESSDDSALAALSEGERTVSTMTAGAAHPPGGLPLDGADAPPPAARTGRSLPSRRGAAMPSPSALPESPHRAGEPRRVLLVDFDAAPADLDWTELAEALRPRLFCESTFAAGRESRALLVTVPDALFAALRTVMTMERGAAVTATCTRRTASGLTLLCGRAMFFAAAATVLGALDEARTALESQLADVDDLITALHILNASLPSERSHDGRHRRD